MLATMKIEAAPKREARDGHQHHNHVHGDHHDHDHEHAADVSEYVRLGLMGLVIVASLTGWWRHWMLRDWLAFTATLVGGFPIFKEAWENLRKRRMTMELSMTLALVAALCIGQFLTALVIAFFVLFAEMVEGYTVGSGRRAIQTLIDALPRQVRVRRGDEERELGTNEVVAGETIIIRPGERIPADGMVIKGHSFVDQSCRVNFPARGQPSDERALAEIKGAILATLRLAIGKDTGMATRHEWYKAAALALRDRIVHHWLTTEKLSYDAGAKRVYYLSLEFLIGRLLTDALNNMGLLPVFATALGDLGGDRFELH